jgi:hypothetical protein
MGALSSKQGRGPERSPKGGEAGGHEDTGNRTPSTIRASKAKRTPEHHKASGLLDSAHQKTHRSCKGERGQGVSGQRMVPDWGARLHAAQAGGLRARLLSQQPTFEKERSR